MRKVLIAVAVLLTVSGARTSHAEAKPAANGSQATKWVCPPCPADCHHEVWHEPGTCPGCGMTLIKKGSALNVAIVLYEGVELLDFAGPGETFSAGGHYNTYTVGPNTEPLTSQGFVSITPHYSPKTAPKPAILVIPGGSIRSVFGDKEYMTWIKRAAKEAEIVLSVCNGALILAKLGLLDGLEATTHHGSIAGLRQMAKNTKVHSDRRFVDNGKFITAAGVSAGIDAALHVLDRLDGRASAKSVAWYMEYDWKPDPKGGATAKAPRPARP